jgi:hypothetical protein
MRGSHYKILFISCLRSSSQRAANVMAPFGRALEMTITNINSFSQQDLFSTNN